MLQQEKMTKEGYWELQRFLNRIGGHPILSEDELLIQFCTSDSEDWKKSKKFAKEHIISKGMLGTKGSENPEDDQILKTKKEIDEKVEIFSEIMNHLSHVSTKRDDVSSYLSVLQKSLNKLAVHQLLSTIPNEENITILKNFSNSYESLSLLLDEMSDYDKLHLYETSKDFIRYCESAKAYINRFESEKKKSQIGDKEKKTRNRRLYSI